MKRLYCKFCGRMLNSKRVCGEFCSYICVAAYKSFSKTQLITKVCLNCGVSFATSGKTRKYCSNDCRKQFRSSASLTYRLRFSILARDRFQCRYCGRSVDDGAKLHVDHINPKSKGGGSELTNLITACQECNLGKSDLLFDGLNTEE